MKRKKGGGFVGNKMGKMRRALKKVQGKMSRIKRKVNYGQRKKGPSGGKVKINERGEEKHMYVMRIQKRKVSIEKVKKKNNDFRIK